MSHLDLHVFSWAIKMRPVSETSVDRTACVAKLSPPCWRWLSTTLSSTWRLLPSAQLCDDNGVLGPLWPRWRWDHKDYKMAWHHVGKTAGLKRTCIVRVRNINPHRFYFVLLLFFTIQPWLYALIVLVRVHVHRHTYRLCMFSYWPASYNIIRYKVNLYTIMEWWCNG